MSEQDPNLVYSSLNQAIVVDGYRFDIQIYRLEHEAAWVLEVVDYQGTSHVWDDQFATDKEAKAEAVKELAEQGASAFMAGDNVVPFKRPFQTGD